LVSLAKVPYYCSGMLEIQEQGTALLGDGGKQVDSAGFRASAATQQTTFGAGHVIIREWGVLDSLAVVFFRGGRFFCRM